MLYQIDVIGLQAFQRSLDLPRRDLFGATIDFGHQKHLLAVAIFQGLAHAQLALAFVVVPAVVHECDTAINAGSDQANAVVVGERSMPEMKSTHPNRGDPLPGAAQRAIQHVSLAGSGRSSEWNLIHGAILL